MCIVHCGRLYLIPSGAGCEQHALSFLATMYVIKPEMYILLVIVKLHWAYSLRFCIIRSPAAKLASATAWCFAIFIHVHVIWICIVSEEIRSITIEFFYLFDRTKCGKFSTQSPIESGWPRVNAHSKPINNHKTVTTCKLTLKLSFLVYCTL